MDVFIYINITDVRYICIYLFNYVVFSIILKFFDSITVSGYILFYHVYAP